MLGGFENAGLCGPRAQNLVPLLRQSIILLPNGDDATEARPPNGRAELWRPAVRLAVRDRGLGLVDEDQARRVKPSLILFPLRPSSGRVGAILLAGVQAIFEADALMPLCRRALPVARNRCDHFTTLAN